MVFFFGNGSFEDFSGVFEGKWVGCLGLASLRSGFLMFVSVRLRMEEEGYWLL